MEVSGKRLLRLYTRKTNIEHYHDRPKSGDEDYSDDKSRARSGDPDFIIVLAPGAFLRWYEARNDFNILCHALYERVLIPRQFSTTDNNKYTIHWLGYGLPEAPYPIWNTVYRSVDTLTQGIDILLRRYRTSKVLCIGHSLGGVVLLRWAITRSQDLVNRVQAIITLNSPLHGLDELLEIYQEEFAEKGGSFMGTDYPPPIAIDLERTSPVISSIVSYEGRSPVNHQLHVTTSNDPIVPPGIATLEYATDDTVELLDVNSEEDYLIHTDALNSQVFIDTVVDKINQVLGDYRETADVNK